MAKGKDKATGDGGGHARQNDPARAGQHHAATAHGQPTAVDESLPATRAELLAAHAAARRRRALAPLGSEAFRQAVDELARIEIRIAAIERAQVPPQG